MLGGHASLGQDMYAIAKPFVLDDLMKKVRELIDEGAVPEGSGLG